MDYTFNMFSSTAKDGICESIKQYNVKNKRPIIVCIGSDLVLGDSLGPLVGTMLKKMDLGTYIYGTLNHPITAKEIEHVKTHLKILHPYSVVIAIDAAVGAENDVGLLRFMDKGLKPGLGVNKNLCAIGDASIIGVVAQKSEQNHKLYNLTRLNFVFKMAEVIANGISQYIMEYNKKQNAV